MSDIYFFATPDELNDILREYEDGNPIKYYRAGIVDGLKGYASARDIPNFGIPENESSIASGNFLIAPAAKVPKLRSIKTTTNRINHHLDQLVNAESVVITPGGFWKKDVLLVGRLATAYATYFSRDQIRRFRKALRRRCTKHTVYWVGDGAARACAESVRLTHAEQSPTKFDLKLSIDDG